ncbi:MAG: tRNA lysidine(34) synthetase TilS [Gemmatales bacterium]|nr:tRNA lysidine(34) synthetase TilS [Gemmatales bacterium]
MSQSVEPDKKRSLPAQVSEVLARFGVGTGPILVAISGGPDSTALLLALVEILGHTQVRAAHLNHQLRGAESDADEQFVSGLCERLHVPLRVERQNVALYARQAGANLEDFARQLRYDWLARIARQYQVPWVATGHTANDQAETVLFRLLRGSGLRGLRGIAWCRPLAQGIQLLRPLLAVTREEVNDYLQAQGVSARQDSSNLDLSRTRNRIRWQLLPLLQGKYNPQVIMHLCQLADQVREWYAWMERQAAALLERMELPRWAGQVVLDAGKTKTADPVLLRQALLLLWQREGWPCGKMTARHWQHLAEFLQSEGHQFDLPDGLKVRRRLHTWVFRRHNEAHFP